MSVNQHQDPMNRAGSFVKEHGEAKPFYAFRPKCLPPNPPLQIGGEMQILLQQANLALGRLDGIAALLPEPDIFIYSYIRKEAVLSSQIEGTQSSLSDLLLWEADDMPGVPVEDLKETSNYIAAMNYGLKRVAEGLPISLRLMKELHSLLVQGDRASGKDPGEFRRIQVWVGGSQPDNTIYVPPPAQFVLPAMSDLEKYIHTSSAQTPTLVKIALIHAQFETIHPFLDGNGRIGRLLITLLLCSQEPPVLSTPLLYLSLYLKQNRSLYYEHLQRIRTEGRWEQWVTFFLEGVIEVATSAIQKTKEIIELIERDRAKIQNIGKASTTAFKAHDFVARKVVMTASLLAKSINVSTPTANNAIAQLQRAEILKEVTGRKRGKVYIYDQYFALLNEGT